MGRPGDGPWGAACHNRSMAPQPAPSRSGRGRSRLAERALTWLAVVAVLVAACSSSPPVSGSLAAGSSASIGPSASSSAGSAGQISPAAAPTATPDDDAIFASIESTVQQLRELTKRSPVNRMILDQDQLKAIITTSFDKSNPPALLAANEQLDKALGLLPPDASLKGLDVELLSSQVAGRYDPAPQTMDVASQTG